MGVSLSGGKNAKTVIAVLDHFPGVNRLALSQLIENLKSEDQTSGDDALLESLKALGKIRSIALDVPLSLPKCVTCPLKCPGVTTCQEPHVQWFRDRHKRLSATKKNLRLFTPYTQRPLEAWLSDQEDCEVPPSDALGANAAPLTTRAQFLMRRLKGHRLLEINARMSLLRLGRRQKLNKKFLTAHKNSLEGERARQYVLGRWSDLDYLFMYAQDQNRLTESSHAFDAVLGALTAFEAVHGRVDPRPEGFPPEETFLAIPT